MTEVKQRLFDWLMAIEREDGSFVVTVLNSAVALWGAALVLLTIVQVIRPQLEGAGLSPVERDQRALQLERVVKRVNQLSVVLFLSIMAIVLAKLTVVKWLTLVGIVLFSIGCIMFLIISWNLASRYVVSPSHEARRR